MSTAHEQLKQLVGAAGFSTDPAEIAPCLEEWRGKYHGKSGLLLKPANTMEVSAILRLAHETGTAIVPQGGNTGLVGAQIPFHGEVLLSLRRMNKIRGLDAHGMTLTAEAGVVLAAVQQAAAEHGLLFPLSLGSEGSCTIGGNISTNAGGNHVLRYGMMRALVLGLEVVLADGRVLAMLKSLHKDNSGYDLKQFFIGAEGTLGVITAASLRLFPKPAEIVTAFAALRAPQAALELLGHMQTLTGGQLSSFELISRPTLELVLRHIPGARDPLSAPAPWYVLMEISGGAGAQLEARGAAALEKALADGLVEDALVVQTEAQARSLWHMRESISEAEKHEGVSIKHDISVPVAAVPAFIEQATAAVTAKFPGARPVIFGHMGDGNLHFNFSAPPGGDKNFTGQWDAMQLCVHDIVKTFAGSISAEHGIGVMKRDMLARYKSSEELDAMRTIKQAFDPMDILNPGKTIPIIHRL